MDRDLDFLATIADLRRRVAALEAVGASHPNAWGKVASATSVSNQTGIGATADITFTTSGLSWASLVGRLYEVTYRIFTRQITSNGTQIIEVHTGTSGAGTVIGLDTTGALTSATLPSWGSGTTYIVGTGATLSVHLRASTSAGTITVENATVRGWVVVKDAGPS